MYGAYFGTSHFDSFGDTNSVKSLQSELVTWLCLGLDAVSESSHTYLEMS